MLTKFRLDSAHDMTRWDAFIDAHPKGTPLHRSGWLKTISEAYTLDPWLFVLEDSSMKVKALVPFFKMRHLFKGNRLVSLPFSDYCVPLGLNESSVLDMLQRILEMSDLDVKGIEIRGYLNNAPGFISYPYYKHHILRLHPDPQEVLKQVDKRTIQYSIRKATREGVALIEDRTQKGMEEFFKLYILTRKKHGIPSHPKAFFLALERNIVEKGQASVLLAVHDSRVVAAGIFMNHRRTVYYKYNVSDPARSVKVVPNHLLTWTAIERGCHRGYEILDFGRTAPDNAGLMRYKNMWGTEVEDLPYICYPASTRPSLSTENGTLYWLAKHIWRHLPESLASKVGPTAMKYLG